MGIWLPYSVKYMVLLKGFPLKICWGIGLFCYADISCFLIFLLLFLWRSLILLSLSILLFFVFLNIFLLKTFWLKYVLGAWYFIWKTSRKLTKLNRNVAELQGLHLASPLPLFSFKWLKIASLQSLPLVYIHHSLTL